MTVGAEWYEGVCDRMLMRIDWWFRNWKFGYEYATRPMTNLKVQGGIEHVVVKREIGIPFRKDELQHLVRILTALQPKGEMTIMFGTALRHFEKRCVPLTNGCREVRVASYHIDAKETLDLLIKAKTGKASEEQFIEDQLSSGKPLW